MLMVVVIVHSHLTAAPLLHLRKGIQRQYLIAVLVIEERCASSIGNSIGVLAQSYCINIFNKKFFRQKTNSISTASLTYDQSDQQSFGGYIGF